MPGTPMPLVCSGESLLLRPKRIDNHSGNYWSFLTSVTLAAQTLWKIATLWWLLDRIVRFAWIWCTFFFIRRP